MSSVPLIQLELVLVGFSFNKARLKSQEVKLDKWLAKLTYKCKHFLNQLTMT